MKRRLLTIHRYVSLSLALFWIIQALTGTILIYARTADDMAMGASARAVSSAGVDRTIAAIGRSGATVHEYFVSGGVPGQIDILVEDRAEGFRVWRVDGASGAVQRVSAWNGPWWKLSLARGALLLHKSLLAGATGRIIVIASAAMLFVNILIALKLAWPMKRRWRSALVPARAGNAVVRSFSWHRALGLWVLPFGLVITLTGLGLSFIPTLEQLTASRAALPPQCRTATAGPMPALSSARALESARQVFPDAGLVVVSLPRADRHCYVLQMRQPTEWRRIFGTSRVYVDARSYDVIGRWDATAAGLPARAVVALYTIHTGEWGGSAGRFATLVMGAGLLATIMLGLWLWWSRRRARGASARSGRQPSARS